MVHDLDGEPLTLYALFTTRELSVREVERALLGRSAAQAVAWLRAQGALVVRSLRVVGP